MMASFPFCRRFGQGVTVAGSWWLLSAVDEFEPVSDGGDMDHAHEVACKLIIAGGAGPVDF
jgi:hypothetical protein